MSKDITKPLRETGRIIEVNSGPGLRMHTDRDVAKPIIESLYPNHDDGRIPIIAITGTNGKTTTVNLVAYLCKLATGKVVGRTTTNGVYIAADKDSRLMKGDCSGPQSARAVLTHPDVEMAVLEVARGGILRDGLGYDKSDVGCVINIGRGDHIGKHFDNATVEDVIRIKSVVLQNIRPGGTAVINLDDPHFGKLVKNVPSDVNIVTFSTSGNENATISYKNGVVRLEPLEPLEPLVPLVPISSVNVENVLAALGCVLSIGLDITRLHQSIQDFFQRSDLNPGRMNRFVLPDGREIIVDYAHNPDAISKLCQATTNPKEVLAVFGAAGDREEDSIREMCDRLRQTFGEVIWFVDPNTLRGSTADRLTEVMRGGRKKDICCESERAALEFVLQQRKQAKRILFLADDVDGVLSALQK